MISVPKTFQTVKRALGSSKLHALEAVFSMSLLCALLLGMCLVRMLLFRMLLHSVLMIRILLFHIIIPRKVVSFGLARHKNSRVKVVILA